MNVIDINDHRDNRPRFSISAVKEGEVWMVSVDDYHDRKASVPDAQRQIADALVSIHGGLIANAEELEPTTRGRVVANIVIYNSGHIDFHSDPINTKKRRAWLGVMLDKARENILGRKVNRKA